MCVGKFAMLIIADAKRAESLARLQSLRVSPMIPFRDVGKSIKGVFFRLLSSLNLRFGGRQACSASKSKAMNEFCVPTASRIGKFSRDSKAEKDNLIDYRNVCWLD